jgi:hypothetical protein
VHFKPFFSRTVFITSFHCFVHSYLFVCLRILPINAHFRALNSKIVLPPAVGFCRP